jgi:glutamate carboxypeptidase
MFSRRHLLLALATAASLCAAPALTVTEQRIAAAAEAGMASFNAELEANVQISSPTEDHAGVRRLGAWFEAEFAKLGFAARWSPIAEAKRAGHVVAERRGAQGRRLLLIGHLDTVLPGGPFRIADGKAYGSGVNDMKGGNLVILHALRALHAAGALENTSIAVILTGDEEDTGEPMSISRRDLYELAQRSDAALGFETAIGDTGTVARRGFASWTLEVQGATGHSSAIWGAAAGSGSIYETSRILARWHEDLRKLDGLTCNPSLIAGGTEVEARAIDVTARGKTNIIPQRTVVKGDLRFLSAEQLAEAKLLMQAAIDAHFPRTSAKLVFDEGSFPAMAPADGNYSLLKVLDQASQDLGYAAITAYDPKARGAGDISIISPPLPGLDGLGLRGGGAHAPSEWADLTTAPELVKRAALLIYRLSR